MPKKKKAKMKARRKKGKKAAKKTKAIAMTFTTKACSQGTETV